MLYYSSNYQKMKMKKDKACAVCGMKHEPPNKNFRFVGWENRFWYYKNIKSGKVIRLKRPLWIRKVVVHHIDGDSKNDDPKNLIYLCNRCHGLAHLLIVKLRWNDKSFWKHFISEKWVRESYKKEIKRHKDELAKIHQVIKRCQQNVL